MLDQRPLVGIRVFEVSNGIAGSMCGRYLAHFGAEVLKVESRRNPDVLRVAVGSGWLDRDKFGLEVWGDSGPKINEYVAGQRSVGVDLKSAEGFKIARRLIGQSDIFLSNYSAPAVTGLKLDYESVRAWKPDIVYVLLSGFGATPGPYYEFLTWGPNLTALTGLDDLTGWPDRPALGVANISYPDYSNGLHGLVAVLTALDYRDQGGGGQFVDLSQFEATVSMLGPLLLDHEVNGHCPTRTGNRVAWAAPQGIFPCRDNDRWIAITVSTDQEWQAFCRVAGRPEWATDERFATLGGRLDHHDELDRLIEAWTSKHQGAEIAEWLQTAGVAAAPLLGPPDLAVDTQLAARSFWILAEHARFGKDLATGNPIHLVETPGHVDRAGPALGQDTEYALKELCGYSESAFQALLEQGVIFSVAKPEVRLERRYWGWIRHFMPDLPWPEPQRIDTAEA